MPCFQELVQVKLDSTYRQPSQVNRASLRAKVAVLRSPSSRAPEAGDERGAYAAERGGE